MSELPVTVFFPDEHGRVRQVEHSDLYPDLTWDNRPDMDGSGASEELQRVWVAMCMALREVQGALIAGKCLALNYAASPLVSEVLGVPVEIRVGYALFSTGKGPGDNVAFGQQWTPDKWKKAFGLNSDIPPANMDYHVWLETAQHVIDLTAFQIAPMMRDSNKAFHIKGKEGTFPPMIYWAKRDLPAHPRDSCGDRKILLYWSPKAKAWLGDALVNDRHEELCSRSREILEALKRGEKVDAASSDLLRAATVAWEVNEAQV
ncbi:MAG: hypothetical protein WBX25_34295 [Rhodomicrobium sp.]